MSPFCTLAWQYSIDFGANLQDNAPRCTVMSLHLQLDEHVSILLCCHLMLGLHLLQLVIKICHLVEFGAQFLHANLKSLSKPTALFDKQRVP